MELAARIDDYGKAAWIGLMIIGFVVFWPIGLAILGYLIWSGRMGSWCKGGPGRWYRSERKQGCRGRRRSSGNTAFDEYREETLRRLEEEQQAFHEYLDRLRQAKDKAEFDQFMAERGTRRPDRGPEPQPQG